MARDDSAHRGPSGQPGPLGQASDAVPIYLAAPPADGRVLDGSCSKTHGFPSTPGTPQDFWKIPGGFPRDEKQVFAVPIYIYLEEELKFL